MRVRIFRPSKSAAQSGRAKSQRWVVEPELASSRTPEPIMGWSSAADTLGEMKGRLSFPSIADALAFCKSNNWDYVLEEPQERQIRPRNYLDNFRIIRPEDEERQQG